MIVLEGTKLGDQRFVVSQAALGKLFNPVGGGLLVEVAHSALAGMGGGEDNAVGMTRAGVDENVGGVGAYVLGDFDGIDHVELPVQIDGFGEVGLLNERRMFGGVDGRRGAFKSFEIGEPA